MLFCEFPFILLECLPGRYQLHNTMSTATVTYDEVKDLPNHPETYLIDVRDPPEIKDTGLIPTSFNIPREYE